MSYAKPRITLEMSMQDAVVELCDGNPGAINAMMTLALSAPRVDPDSAFGMWTPLLDLDSLNIYGSRIWQLYNDVCERSYVTNLTLFRAHQLGFLTESRINQLIDSGRPIEPVEYAELQSKVTTFLPDFNINA